MNARVATPPARGGDLCPIERRGEDLCPIEPRVESLPSRDDRAVISAERPAAPPPAARRPPRRPSPRSLPPRVLAARQDWRACVGPALRGRPRDAAASLSLDQSCRGFLAATAAAAATPRDRSGRRRASNPPGLARCAAAPLAAVLGAASVGA